MASPTDNFHKLIKLDKPWWSIAAIDHIETLLNPNMRVFEYGSGASTIWFSKRVGEVISQESHPEFYKFMSDQTSTKLLHVSQHNEPAYLDEIKNHGKFDLILIDAALRIKCLNQAPEFLTEDGIIVFDNSGWDKFQDGLNEFESNNPQFQKNTLSGMKYVYEENDGEEETRVYYK